MCLALFVQTGVLSHSSLYGLKRVSVYTRTRKSRRQPFANKTCVCVGECRTCIHIVHNWIQSSKYSFISKVQNRYIDFFSGNIVEEICVFYTSRTSFQQAKKFYFFPTELFLHGTRTRFTLQRTGNLRV